MWENWDLFREMNSLHREFDRILKSAWPNERSPGERSPFRSSFLPGLSARSYPMVNIYEDQEAVHVEALAPGLDTDSVKVSVVGNTLTLSGEKPPLREVKTESFHRNERAAGRFIRTIDLATEVNTDKVKAEYKEGILSVTMPKSEKAKPKQIAIKVE